MAILEVSNRTINFNRRTLNLRTVTAIDKVHRRSSQPFSTQSIVCAVLFCLVLVLMMAVPGMRVRGFVIPAFATVLGCVFYATYAAARNTEPRDYWLLRVETASGTKTVVASRDERSIDDAVAAIKAALESDVSMHTTLNIADSTLVTDSVIQHSRIENISGSV